MGDEYRVRYMGETRYNIVRSSPRGGPNGTPATISGNFSFDFWSATRFKSQFGANKGSVEYAPVVKPDPYEERGFVVPGGITSVVERNEEDRKKYISSHFVENPVTRLVNTLVSASDRTLEARARGRATSTWEGAAMNILSEGAPGSEEYADVAGGTRFVNRNNMSMVRSASNMLILQTITPEDAGKDERSMRSSALESLKSWISTPAVARDSGNFLAFNQLGLAIGRKNANTLIPYSQGYRSVTDPSGREYAEVYLPGDPSKSSKHYNVMYGRREGVTPLDATGVPIQAGAIRGARGWGIRRTTADYRGQVPQESWIGGLLMTRSLPIPGTGQYFPQNVSSAGISSVGFDTVRELPVTSDIGGLLSGTVKYTPASDLMGRHHPGMTRMSYGTLEAQGELPISLSTRNKAGGFRPSNQQLVLPQYYDPKTGLGMVYSEGNARLGTEITETQAAALSKSLGIDVRLDPFSDRAMWRSEGFLSTGAKVAGLGLKTALTAMLGRPSIGIGKTDLPVDIATGEVKSFPTMLLSNFPTLSRARQADLLRETGARLNNPAFTRAASRVQKGGYGERLDMERLAEDIYGVGAPVNELMKEVYGTVVPGLGENPTQVEIARYAASDVNLRNLERYGIGFIDPSMESRGVRVPELSWRVSKKQFVDLEQAYLAANRERVIAAGGDPRKISIKDARQAFLTEYGLTPVANEPGMWQAHTKASGFYIRGALPLGVEWYGAGQVHAEEAQLVNAISPEWAYRLGIGLTPGSKGRGGYDRNISPTRQAKILAAKTVAAMYADTPMGIEHSVVTDTMAGNLVADTDFMALLERKPDNPGTVADFDIVRERMQREMEIAYGNKAANVDKVPLQFGDLEGAYLLPAGSIRATMAVDQATGQDQARLLDRYLGTLGRALRGQVAGKPGEITHSLYGLADTYAESMGVSSHTKSDMVKDLMGSDLGWSVGRYGWAGEVQQHQVTGSKAVWLQQIRAEIAEQVGVDTENNPLTDAEIEEIYGSVANVSAFSEGVPGLAMRYPIVGGSKESALGVRFLTPEQAQKQGVATVDTPFGDYWNISTGLSSIFQGDFDLDQMATLMGIKAYRDKGGKLRHSWTQLDEKGNIDPKLMASINRSATMNYQDLQRKMFPSSAMQNRFNPLLGAFSDRFAGQNVGDLGFSYRLMRKQMAASRFYNIGELLTGTHIVQKAAGEEMGASYNLTRALESASIMSRWSTASIQKSRVSRAPVYQPYLDKSTSIPVSMTEMFRTAYLSTPEGAMAPELGWATPEAKELSTEPQWTKRKIALTPENAMPFLRALTESAARPHVVPGKFADLPSPNLLARALAPYPGMAFGTIKPRYLKAYNSQFKTWEDLVVGGGTDEQIAQAGKFFKGVPLEAAIKSAQEATWGLGESDQDLLLGRRTKGTADVVEAWYKQNIPEDLQQVYASTLAQSMIGKAYFSAQADATKTIPSSWEKSDFGAETVQRARRWRVGYDMARGIVPEMGAFKETYDWLSGIDRSVRSQGAELILRMGKLFGAAEAVPLSMAGSQMLYEKAMAAPISLRSSTYGDIGNPVYTNKLVGGNKRVDSGLYSSVLSTVASTLNLGGMDVNALQAAFLPSDEQGLAHMRRGNRFEDRLAKVAGEAMYHSGLSGYANLGSGDPTKAVSSAFSLVEDIELGDGQRTTVVMHGTPDFLLPIGGKLYEVETKNPQKQAGTKAAQMEKYKAQTDMVRYIIEKKVGRILNPNLAQGFRDKEAAELRSSLRWYMPEEQIDEAYEMLLAQGGAGSILFNVGADTDLYKSIMHGKIDKAHAQVMKEVASEDSPYVVERVEPLAGGQYAERFEKNKMRAIREVYSKRGGVLEELVGLLSPAQKFHRMRLGQNPDLATTWQSRRAMDVLQRARHGLLSLGKYFYDLREAAHAASPGATRAATPEEQAAAASTPPQPPPVAQNASSPRAQTATPGTAPASQTPITNAADMPIEELRARASMLGLSRTAAAKKTKEQLVEFLDPANKDRTPVGQRLSKSSISDLQRGLLEADSAMAYAPYVPPPATPVQANPGPTAGAAPPPSVPPTPGVNAAAAAAATAGLAAMAGGGQPGSPGDTSGSPGQPPEGGGFIKPTSVAQQIVGLYRTRGQAIQEAAIALRTQFGVTERGTLRRGITGREEEFAQAALKHQEAIMDAQALVAMGVAFQKGPRGVDMGFLDKDAADIIDKVTTTGTPMGKDLLDLEGAGQEMTRYSKAAIKRARLANLERRLATGGVGDQISSWFGDGVTPMDPDDLAAQIEKNPAAAEAFRIARNFSKKDATRMASEFPRSAALIQYTEGMKGHPGFDAAIKEKPAATKSLIADDVKATWAEKFTRAADEATAALKKFSGAAQKTSDLHEKTAQALKALSIEEAYGKLITAAAKVGKEPEKDNLGRLKLSPTGRAQYESLTAQEAAAAEIGDVESYQSALTGFQQATTAPTTKKGAIGRLVDRLAGPPEPDDPAINMRRFLGGFGLMYLRSLWGIATGGLGYGMQERAETMQQLGGPSAQMFGAIYRPNVPGVALRNIMGATGVGGNPLLQFQEMYARTPLLQDAGTALGAGLGTYALAQQVGMWSGSNTLKSILGKWAVPIAAGVSAATLLSSAAGKLSDTESVGYRLATAPVLGKSFTDEWAYLMGSQQQKEQIGIAIGQYERITKGGFSQGSTRNIRSVSQMIPVDTPVGEYFGTVEEKISLAATGRPDLYNTLTEGQRASTYQRLTQAQISHFAPQFSAEASQAAMDFAFRTRAVMGQTGMQTLTARIQQGYSPQIAQAYMAASGYSVAGMYAGAAGPGTQANLMNYYNTLAPMATTQNLPYLEAAIGVMGATIPMNTYITQMGMRGAIGMDTEAYQKALAALVPGSSQYNQYTAAGAQWARLQEFGRAASPPNPVDFTTMNAQETRLEELRQAEMQESLNTEDALQRALVLRGFSAQDAYAFTRGIYTTARGGQLSEYETTTELGRELERQQRLGLVEKWFTDRGVSARQRKQMYAPEYEKMSISQLQQYMQKQSVAEGLESALIGAGVSYNISDILAIPGGTMQQAAVSASVAQEIQAQAASGVTGFSLTQLYENAKGAGPQEFAGMVSTQQWMRETMAPLMRQTGRMPGWAADAWATSGQSAANWGANVPRAWRDIYQGVAQYDPWASTQMYAYQQMGIQPPNIGLPELTNLPSEMVTRDIWQTGPMAGLPLNAPMWTVSGASHPNFPLLQATTGGAVNWGTGVGKAFSQGYTIPGMSFPVAGIMGMQSYMQQLQYQSGMAQIGNQLAQLNMSMAFQTGVGLDAYAGIINPQTNKPFGFNTGPSSWSIPGVGRYTSEGGGMWGIQDAMRNLGYAQQEWQFGFQERQLGMSRSQFAENFSLNRQQTLMQRGWAMQDWGYQDTTRNLQWQWRQEDYAEQARFMTGRDRRLAERGMKRETTMFNLETEQIDKQRERQKEMWKLEDERFKLQKKHFEEQMVMQEEQQDMMRKFYAERIALEEEQIKLQRAQQVQQAEYQKQSLGIQAAMLAAQKEYSEIQSGIELANLAIQSGIADVQAKQSGLVTLTEDNIEAVFASLNDWIARVLGTLGGGPPVPTTTNPPHSQSGYIPEEDIESDPPTHGGAHGTFVSAGQGTVVSEEGLIEFFTPQNSGTIIPLKSFNAWTTTVMPSQKPVVETSTPKTINIFIGDQHLKTFVLDAIDEALEA
jgi:hypothetical protein